MRHSYADDNIPYTSDISLNLVLEKLESSTHDIFRWFKESTLKLILRSSLSDN